MPFADDFNNKETANYCGNCYGDEYVRCRSAKLWYIPQGDIIGNTVNWANWNNYLYETNLIQYNTNGEIIVYGGEELSLTPEYTLDVALNEDNQVVTTTIDVA